MKKCPDVSYYQYRYASNGDIEKYIDFQKMRGQVDSVIVRAGQNTWQDIAFTTSWLAAKEAGLQRGSYWFFDSRANPKRQAEKWVDALGNDAGELELWCDFEEKYGGLFGGMANWYDFTERVKTLLPHKQLGVYTGYYYWRENFKSESLQNYFGQYPLWIAAYNTDSPRIPSPWTDWLMWQYTDNGQGDLYGVPSGNIDLNYRRGEIVGNPPTRPQLVASFDGVEVVYETA